MFRRKKGPHPRDDSSATGQGRAASSSNNDGRPSRPASADAVDADQASGRACPAADQPPHANGEGGGDSPRRRKHSHSHRSHGRNDNATATADDTADDDTTGSNANDELFSLVPPYLRSVLHHYHGDFFFTPQTDPRLFVQVMAEGFLPIASRYGNRTLVLPKLHEERCVIRPITDMHTPKSVRKKAKHYSLTLNRNFDGVVAGCHKQHGINWLYPPVVESFRAINSTGEAGMDAMLFDDSAPNDGGGGGGSPPRPVGSCPVRLYSVEVRRVTDTTDDLVAGELGYTVGNVYTSLTGFTAEDGAGSVQLAALGALLIKCGFDVWDMGMYMDYKGRLGASLMPRGDFVRMVRRGRVERPDVRLTCGCDGRGANCKEIITGEAAMVGGGGGNAVDRKKSNPKAKEEEGNGTAGKGQAGAKMTSPKRRKRDLDGDVSRETGHPVGT